MEKSLNTTRTITPTVGSEALVLRDEDPRLTAANAQFDEPLSMADINDRNAALAEQRLQKQSDDSKLFADDYRKAIEAAIPANPDRSMANRRAIGKTVLTYREAIGY